MEILNIDFQIPEPNKQQLKDIDDKIEKLKTRFLLIKTNKEELTDDQYLTMYKLLFRILDKLGTLSTPAFNMENEIEDVYKTNYKHAPDLCNALYQECCSKIHKPYDRLKNHAHDLIDNIEEYYIKTNHTNPPEISEGELLYS